MALILDLETAAIDDAAQYVKPDSRLKDAAKIAASIDERASKAALNPWLCRIIALGWCYEGEEVERVEVAANEAAETTLLKAFWPRIWDLDEHSGGAMPIVTFNGLSFDLPVLMARSMLLGVPHATLNLDRYRSPHVDLLQRLSWFDKEKALSLKFYCRRFGINTDDAFTGAMIAECLANGDWESIKLHCASDVRLTRQLAERIGVCKARPKVAA